MKEQKPRLVLVSSAAVYGDQGDYDYTEKNIRSPISPYGFHKYSAEILCESYSRSFGVEVSIVRLFSVYGEGLCKQLLWDALNKFSNGQNEFLGTGSELRDWIHVEDAAELLTLAGVRSQLKFDIYNGGGEIATCRDILEKLGKAYGANSEVLFNNLTHKGNPHRLTSDGHYTKNILKWQPNISLDEGLQRYISWFSSFNINK
jgi:UDP-glucose 4-epimerase